jgi:peptide/nickel transport system permease protein
MGRDIFSRILYGTHITLQIALFAVMIGFVSGTVIGLCAGYFRGKLDIAVSYLTDILLAFPGFLLAIAIVAAIGPGILGVVIASGFSSIPQFIRIVRGVAFVEKEKDYVLAARAIGEGDAAILARYILPNCLAPLIVMLTLRMAAVILIASGLSFLGLGAQPPSPEWGAMLSEGQGYLQSAPHISIFPGLAIMIVVLSFNMLGDGLRDALDPRMKV